MRTLLSNRDFLRLFGGRLVTNAGDSLYFVAAMWLVYDLTGNEFYSGLAGFLTMAPQALQAFSGPLVDRWNLKRVLVGTQLVQAALVLAIPLAALTDHLTAWVVLAVMPTLSLLNQFAYPAQSALLPRIVADDDLVAANSAFSMAYQGVDAAFNAVGGVLVALVGATVIFLFDSVTFVAAAALFAMLAVPARDGPVDEAATDVDEAATDRADDANSSAATDGGDGNDSPSCDDSQSGDDGQSDDDGPDGYFDSFHEGVSFVRGSVLAPMLAGSLVINSTLGAVIAVLPSYGEALGGGGVGGAGTYGFLMAAIGAGMFVGALASNVVADRRFGPLLVGSMTVGGVAWIAAISISTPTATVVLFTLAHVPVGLTNVLIVSMIQSLVPDGLLGRVMGVVGSVSSVAMPFGAVAGGALAASYGPTLVMYGGGIGFVFLAAYNAAVPSIRRLPAVGDVERLST